MLAVEHLQGVRNRVRRLALRFWDRFTYRLRPKYLRHCGHSVRMRWWIHAQAIYVIDPAVDPLLNEGRALMYDNHEAGMNHPMYARGRRAAVIARELQERMVILAKGAGPQYVDGTSSVDLMAIARRIR